MSNQTTLSIHDIEISDDTGWSKDSDLRIKCYLRTSEYDAMMKDFEGNTLFVYIDADNDGDKYILKVDELGFMYTDKHGCTYFGEMPNDEQFNQKMNALEELNKQHPGGDVCICASLF